MPTLTTTVPLRFSDFDLLGHVNNVAYLELFETARSSLLSSVAPSVWGGVLLARTECDYLAEVPVGTATVEIAVSVEKLGTSSFVVLQELVHEGRVAARGRVTMVATGDDRRPRPLTEDERALLTG